MSDYNAKEGKIIEMIESLIRNGVDAELIVSRFESKIFDLKKPELYFWFAKNVKGIDVKAHEQVVFKYGNQIESELESLDNYLDDAIASSEKDASKSMTK